MAAMKPGLRLKSAVCSTEIMIIRSPPCDAGVAPAEICCGGVEMLELTEQPAPGARLDPAQAHGSLIGKRYVDAQDRVEILCTQGGAGSLVLDGVLMALKQAKALPSSD
jgi:hypothetical protein